MKRELKNCSNIMRIMLMIWKKTLVMDGLRPLIQKIKRQAEEKMLLTLMKMEMDNKCKLCQPLIINRPKMMLSILTIVMMRMFLRNPPLK